jgi:glyoxylase-like metal-dependent hydrolase (beta-lactamase superfamily II)
MLVNYSGTWLENIFAMPIDYSQYHPKWHTISRFIRFYRARNCCEFCGVGNYRTGYWVDDRFVTVEEWDEKLSKDGVDLYHGIPTDKPLTKIILTVAHLDHDINNNSFFNLKALCQRCHLNHDRKDNLRRRKMNRFPNQLKLEL